MIHWLWDAPCPPRFTAISRKVVGENVHATIPKGNYGICSIHCSWHCSCRTYFCCFPLALADIYPRPLLPFFQISLKNSELKITHRSGLSRALYPTTFLEIAVYIRVVLKLARDITSDQVSVLLHNKNLMHRSIFPEVRHVWSALKISQREVNLRQWGWTNLGA